MGNGNFLPGRRGNRHLGARKKASVFGGPREERKVTSVYETLRTKEAALHFNCHGEPLGRSTKTVIRFRFQKDQLFFLVTQLCGERSLWDTSECVEPLVLDKMPHFNSFCLFVLNLFLIVFKACCFKQL